MVSDLDERKSCFYPKCCLFSYQIAYEYFFPNLSVESHRKMRVVPFSTTVRGTKVINIKGSAK